MAARKKAATRKKVTRKKSSSPHGGGNTAGRPKLGDHAKYTTFLNAYRKIGNKKQAAALAGVSVNSVREKELADPAFANRVAKARGAIVKKLAEAQIVAATKPDAHGRMDTKAGQFMLTNLDPENYKHRREETTFDGGAYDSGIKEARKSLTEEEKRELQEMGKKRILQSGSG